MEIVKTQTDGKLNLAISGKLSAATAGEFGVHVDAAIADCKQIVMDFAEVSYLASAGLRVLISAQKKLNAAGGTLSICNVREEVFEVFEVTGLNDVFDIKK
jgi:anti-sigma B factor antagonist